MFCHADTLGKEIYPNDNNNIYLKKKKKKVGLRDSTCNPDCHYVWIHKNQVLFKKI